jgi:aspartate 1-decarboxylase
MFRNMMKAKIHRAVVTEANLHYVGSITIDEDLIDAVGMYPNEKVQIVNNNNGARLDTYIIPGPRGSGMICLNGAAARLVQTGDVIIIVDYVWMTEDEIQAHPPIIAIMDEHNRIVQLINEEKHSTIL